MDEATLLEKLRKIEALHEGATTEGERAAARAVADLIRARLDALRATEPDEEMQYSLPDPWGRKLFTALCRRYGLEPYRYRGQRVSTVIVRAPLAFQDKTLWPEYRALKDALDAHLEEVTSRVIAAAIHEDSSDVPAVAEPRGLPSGRSP